MIARLLIGLRLLLFAVWHDLRQRQGAWRCWVCNPIRHHTAQSVAEYREAVGEEVQRCD